MSQASRRSSALIICPPGRYREGLWALMDSLPCFDQVAVADTLLAMTADSVQPPPSLVVIDGLEWGPDVEPDWPLLRAAWPAARWVFVIEPGQAPPGAEPIRVLLRGFSLDTLAVTVRSLLGDEAGFIQ